jgi:biopolymer transport protein ExbD
MAMGQVPGSGRESDDADLDDGVFAEINITPLTDIFLVLLIIFMVTSSVIVNQGGGGAQAGLRVNLPSGGRAADVALRQTDVSVAVLADGRLVLNGTVVTAEELRRSLEEIRKTSPDTLVVVQADEGVQHGKVVQVMEAAKGAGLAQLAIGVRESPK